MHGLPRVPAPTMSPSAGQIPDTGLTWALLCRGLCMSLEAALKLTPSPQLARLVFRVLCTNGGSCHDGRNAPLVHIQGLARIGVPRTESDQHPTDLGKEPLHLSGTESICQGSPCFGSSAPLRPSPRPTPMSRPFLILALTEHQATGNVQRAVGSKCWPHTPSLAGCLICDPSQTPLST